MTTHGTRSEVRRQRDSAPFYRGDELIDPFDRSIFWSLVGLLSFAPLALGAVQAWSELVVHALAATMAACLGLKLLIRPGARFHWNWGYCPIAAMLILAVAQLAPWPTPLVAALSPQSVELKNSLVAVANPAAAHPAWTFLTFYPEATKHDLRLLISTATVFVVVLNTFVRSSQVMKLLSAITVIGGGIAGIALLHHALGVNRIYGSIGEPSRWITAPFLNRNHFGQFLNLSLGAGIGLLFIHVNRLLRGHRFEYETEQRATRLTPAMVVTFLMIALIGTGVFLSLSRGAIGSLVVSGIAVLVIGRRLGMRRRLWALAPLLIILAAIVTVFGFDVITARFADAMDPASHSTAGRLRMCADTLRGWRQFPLLGTGLGTFEVFYPMLDSSDWPSLATHAENEYAQVMLETGLLGAISVLAFLIVISGNYVACLRAPSSRTRAIALGLGFGLLATLIHSLVDFGQHAPANAMLAAVSFGLVAGLGSAKSEDSCSDRPVKARLVRIRRAIAMAPLACVAAWVLGSASRSAIAERSWTEASAMERNAIHQEWRITQNQFARLLLAGMAAHEQCPGNIRYFYGLSLWRWKLISSIRDDRTGEMLLNAQQVQWARDLCDRIGRGITDCPTYGPLYLLAGQIQKYALGSADGEALIRVGCRLSRNDPLANFEAAMLDAEKANWDTAMAGFEHAADLDSNYRVDGVAALAGRFGRIDLALTLSGRDVPSMRKLLAVVEQSGSRSEEPAIRDRLAGVILAAATDPAATSQAIIDAARWQRDQGKLVDSLRFYRTALGREPLDASLRLETARVMISAGDYSDALEQAQLAQRLGASGADALILDIRTRPTTLPAGR